MPAPLVSDVLCSIIEPLLPVEPAKSKGGRRRVCNGAAVTCANVHDSKPLESLLDGIPPVPGKQGRPQCRPDKLHADKAYDLRRCRQACRNRGIKARIARRDIATSKKLGRHR